MSTRVCVIIQNPILFVYNNMTNPTTAATTPVKNLPVLRPRAPLELPCALPEELEGREEVEEGDPDPELLGGVEEVREGAEEEAGEGLELVGPIGRELASAICCRTGGVKVPLIPVNSNLAEKAKAGY